MNENTYVDLWQVKMDVNKQFTKTKKCYYRLYYHMLLVVILL
jgi:hypothetical protein